MTDIRAHLTDVLANHHWHATRDGDAFCVCDSSKEIRHSEFFDHFVDVLLSLPDIAIVDLPEPKGIGAWPVGSDTVEAHHGLVWIPFTDAYEEPFTEAWCPDNARDLAAALLAAANAAEREAGG
jgi:hypothetical protein